MLETLNLILAIVLLIFAGCGGAWIVWVWKRRGTAAPALLLGGALCALEAYNQALLLVSSVTGPTDGLKGAYYLPTYAHDLLVPMWVPALWHMIRTLLATQYPLKRQYPKKCPGICTPADRATKCSWTSIVCGVALATVATVAESMFVLSEKPVFGSTIFVPDTAAHPGVLPLELVPIVIAALFIVYAGGLFAYLSGRWLLLVAGIVCFVGNILPGDLCVYQVSSFTEIFLFICVGVEYDWLLAVAQMKADPLLP